MNAVGWQIIQVECLHHDALSAECGVSVKNDGQVTVAVLVTAVERLCAYFALHHRVGS